LEWGRSLQTGTRGSTRLLLMKSALMCLFIKESVPKSSNLLPPSLKILMKHWLKIFGILCVCARLWKNFWYHIYIPWCVLEPKGPFSNVFRRLIENLIVPGRKFANQKVSQSQKFCKPANFRIFVLRNLFVLVPSNMTLVIEFCVF